MIPLFFAFFFTPFGFKVLKIADVSIRVALWWSNLLSDKHRGFCFTPMA